jgi:hypothetical protein
MSTLNLNSSNYYDVLGCSRDADEGILKKAYRKLARMVRTVCRTSQFQALCVLTLLLFAIGLPQSFSCSGIPTRTMVLPWPRRSFSGSGKPITVCRTPCSVSGMTEKTRPIPTMKKIKTWRVMKVKRIVAPHPPN